MNLSMQMCVEESWEWDVNFWTELFDKAKKKGKIKCAVFDGVSFEYALINPRDSYGKCRVSTDGEPYYFQGSHVTDVIKSLEESVGHNDSGLAFVFERSLPRKDFADFIGLHEHIEAGLRLPDEFLYCKEPYVRMMHGGACKAELEQVLKQNGDFVNVYADWVVSLEQRDGSSGYFGRAINGFSDFVLNSSLPAVEILKEFKKQLDDGRHLC